MKKKEMRQNSVGIPMISESMRQKLFPNTKGIPSKVARLRAQRLLEQFNLYGDLDVQITPNSVDLPDIEGDNLLDHFNHMAKEIAQPYLGMAEALARMDIPEMPTKWRKQAGWTRYVPGERPEAVMHPIEPYSVFDVEVLVRSGNYPVMAVCVTNVAWYGWVSPFLCRGTKNSLIPFGEGKQLIVGWNCFPEDTDVLTDKGWKRIREVEIGDKVMSLNKETGLNEYTKVTGLVDGGLQEVIESKSRGKITRSTRNHRWITQKAWDVGTNKFQVKTTEELMNAGKHSKDNYVVSRPFINTNGSDITPQEAGLLAWVLGDGDIQFRNGKVEVTITQSLNNYDYCERIEKLIVESGQELRFYDFDKTCRRYRLTRKWLETTLGKAKINLDENYLANLDKLVLSLSEEALNSFVDNFWYAEGDKSSPKLRRIHQNYGVNKEKYEAIELACYLLGRVVTSDTSLKVVNSHGRGSYQVAHTKYRSIGQQQVYCIQTEAENFVIRQGRFITLTMNCGYDRARVLEEYNFEASNLRFWDAMSMHIAIAGLSGKQLNHYKSLKKHIADDDYGGYIPKWAYETTTNSLKAAAEFYLGDEVNKDIRDVFVDGTVQDIHDNFQDLMAYNAEDVLTTLKIYKILWFKFRRACPSDVTFAGMLTMGKSFLPVGDRWKSYIPRCQAAFNKAKRNMDGKISALAEKMISIYGENGSLDANDCPWMRNLDWGIPSKLSKKLRDKPEWYRKATSLGKKKITSRNSVVPYLLRMSWLGFPLYCDKDLKWGYLVPIGSEYTTNTRSFKVEEYPEHLFYKIPHKNGQDANCGNPLAKDYLDSMESGVLTAQDPDAQEILELAISISYWVSIQNRVYQQFCHYAESDGKQEYGMILPQVIVSGTVTRRAVEPTWLTASNPKSNRIGSEIKTVVKLPKGYVRLGADVDSQELWLSDLIGDSFIGVVGGTPSSLQTLIGTKENGKDMHTVFAKEMGMSRDGAKQLNYARRYGSGLAAQVTYLRQYIKGLSDADAKGLARKAMAKTKGRKKEGKYVGGTESIMFNQLEKIATSPDPRTPFLNCGISYALHPRNVHRDHMPSRINWVVQSSGVDFLHSLIVAAEYLFKNYAKIWYRFMISVHDEVHWIVKEEDRYKAAYWWQIAHLWVRAFFNYQVGFEDLSETVAWFSGVDIDKTWRKTPSEGCITPSNPYAIPPGLEVTMNDILKKKEEHPELFGEEL